MQSKRWDTINTYSWPVTYNRIFAPFKRRIDTLNVIDTAPQPCQDILSQHRTLVHFQSAHLYWCCRPSKGRCRRGRGRCAIWVSSIYHLDELCDAIRVCRASAQPKVF